MALVGDEGSLLLERARVVPLLPGTLAQVVLEALAAQSVAADGDTLHDVRQLLPGIGEPESLRVPDESPVVGRSLADLDLRGVTGATVLAIARDGHGIAVPAPTEVLRGGDVLAVAGTHDAIAAARAFVCRIL